jgi:hypothetical protein
MNSHHDVLGDGAAIVVVNDDRRGNGDSFPVTEEVELFVNDAVVPVDFAGIGVARLSADCECCLERCDLGGGQLRRVVVRRVLPRECLVRRIDRVCRGAVIEIGIGECDRAWGSCIRC